MKRAPTAVAIALAAVLSAPACSQEDIVLGTVPDNGSSVNAKTGARCVTSAECGESAFCNRHDCAADAGICEPLPVSCDNHEDHVCGCDGVTYFNDCLRRAAGVRGSDADECERAPLLTTPKPCGADTDCPPHAVCAFLFKGSSGLDCVPPLGGRCWDIPPVCPADGHFSSPDRWVGCGGDSGDPCLNTCLAIQSGEPHIRTPTCL
jgi:hypothetical protein